MKDRKITTSSLKKLLAPLASVIFALAFAVLLFAPSPFISSLVPLAHATAIEKSPTNLGLLAYWSFNEGSGTSAFDYSGNKNTGTLVGSPTWTGGKVGGALGFTGATGVYVTGSGTGLPDAGNSGNVTVSAWVYLNAVPGSKETVFNKGNSGGCFNYGMVILSGGVIGSRNGTSDPQLGTAALAAGKWYHLVIVYSASGATGYLNGVSIGSNALGTTLSCADTNWIIGARAYNATSAENFNGKIDQVRIYNRGLSQTEITALYQSGFDKIKAATNLGLIGYWSFDEGAGSTAYDYSGNKKNGTLQNAPLWTNGKLGNALSFDGSTQYVTASFTSPAGALTYSAWVYVGNNVAADRYIISVQNSGLAGGRLLRMSGGGVNRAQFEVINDSNTIYDANFDKLNPNTWYLITGTLDLVANTVNLYVNGQLKASTAVSGAFTTSLSNFTIGRRADASSLFFTGKIDEARVYNRALTATEVTTLYQAGLTTINHSQDSINTNGLVSMWSFNGSDMNWTKNQALDSSGQGDTGTLIGFSTTTSPIAGRIGQALYFAGGNQFGGSQHINATTTMDGITSAMTVSAWIKTTSSDAYMGIISKDDGSTNRSWKLGFNVATGVPRFDVFYSGSTYASVNANVVVNDGLWHMITGTYDGTNLLIYVDGTVRTAPVTGAGGPVAGTAPIEIGNDGCCTPRDFLGSIDDVRIYNRTLSAAEVKQLYNVGK